MGYGDVVYGGNKKGVNQAASPKPPVVQNNASGSSPAAVAAMIQNYQPPVTLTPKPAPVTVPAADTQQPQQQQVAAPASLVSTYTKKETGGRVVTYAVYSDGSQKEMSSYTDKSAGDAVREMFNLVGLDEKFTNALVGTIDNIYTNNVDPSSSQILSAVYNSDAYKTRFKANEVIKQRIASGQSRPGDAMLTPKEYIDLENQYRQIMQSAGMPEGFYDQTDDFTNLIANGISAAEMQSRVQTASDALNKADSNTKNALQQFYGLSNSDLVAYMLDPTRALPILNGREFKNSAYGLNSATELANAYSTAQVGGSALRQGVEADYGLSSEIAQAGKQQYADNAFATAAEQNADVQRLGKMYGASMDFRDLVKESLDLTGGAASARQRKKFASKERAAFGGSSAINKNSLSSMQDV